MNNIIILLLMGRVQSNNVDFIYCIFMARYNIIRGCIVGLNSSNLNLIVLQSAACYIYRSIPIIVSRQSALRHTRTI